MIQPFRRGLFAVLSSRRLLPPHLHQPNPSNARLLASRTTATTPTSTTTAAEAATTQLPPPLSLDANQTITEGPSWVTISPNHLVHTPRERSQQLRAVGDYRQAHAVLRRAGILHTRNQDDLIEYLLVLQHTDEFSGPHQRLTAMLDAIWSAPIRKSQKAFRIVLNACAYEAANVSDNAVLKLATVERTAETVWHEMRQFRRSIDSNTVAFIYRICGLCRALTLAQRIRGDVNDPIIAPSSKAALNMRKNATPAAATAEGRKKDDVGEQEYGAGGCGGCSEDTLAEYILCLGKCGKPIEAEQVFFVQQNRQFRSSPRVLASLFQAYLAATRLSKAEALISMNGASFLDLGSCNAFIRQCANLRLFETAISFLDRMERSHETGFPEPVARTYNILLHGVSSTRAAADENFDQTAEAIVARMKRHNIHPTTVTYNTLIRSFVVRSKMKEAMGLFKAMHRPDRITFSHLMQGAAKISSDPAAAEAGVDVAHIAAELLQALQRFDVRPTYGFCKSYLHVMAAVHGVDHAYEQAHHLVNTFADSLVFGDVGAEEAIRMALIHACGKVGDLPSAFRALKADFGHSHTDGGPLAPLYVATVLMQACLDCGSEGQALEVFESLKASGLEPNFEVYESLIKGLCQYVRDHAHVVYDDIDDNAAQWSLQEGTSGMRNGEQYLHRNKGGDDVHEVAAVQEEEDYTGRFDDDDEHHSDKVDRRFDDDQHDEIIDENQGHVTRMTSAHNSSARAAHVRDDDERNNVRGSSSSSSSGSGSRGGRHSANTVSAQDVTDVFDVSLKLVSEMHEHGAARTTRHAAFTYNLLIVAAAAVGRFELALEIFRRMTQHSNTKLIYVTGGDSSSSPGGRSSGRGDGSSDEEGAKWRELQDWGELPAATVNTYNSMMAAAWRCGRADAAVMMFNRMQMDRETEPNMATLGLLADIGVQSGEAGVVQKILSELDRVRLPKRISRKRVLLRQRLLALRWPR